MKQQPTSAQQSRPTIEALASRLDPGPYDEHWDELFRARLAAERAAGAGHRAFRTAPPRVIRLHPPRLRVIAAPLAAAAVVTVGIFVVWRLVRDENSFIFVHAAGASADLASPEPAFARQRLTPGRDMTTGASVHRLHVDRTFDLALAPGASFRVLSPRVDDPEVRLELGRGQIWGATFDRFAERCRIRIAAGPSEILVSGTRWMAEHDPEKETVRLAVFAGAVELRCAGLQRSVPAGSLVVVDGRGLSHAETTAVPAALNRLSWIEWHHGLLLDRATFHVQLALPPAAGRVATLRSVPFLVVGSGGSASWRDRGIQAAMVGLAADSLADPEQRQAAHAQAAAEVASLLSHSGLPMASRPGLALFAAAHQRLAGNRAEMLRWTDIARQAAAALDDPVHAALGLAFEVSLRAELGQATVATRLLAELRDRFPESPEVAELAGL